jgi:hypothetical protein
MKLNMYSLLIDRQNHINYINNIISPITIYHIIFSIYTLGPVFCDGIPHRDRKKVRSGSGFEFDSVPAYCLDPFHTDSSKLLFHRKLI